MLLRALRAGGKKNFRRGGVRIFFEKMVLDLPHVVDAETIGQFDLVERVVEQPSARHPPSTGAATDVRRTDRISKAFSLQVSRLARSGTANKFQMTRSCYHLLQSAYTLTNRLVNGLTD